MGVFAVVYLVGGIVYQRTVMHARGWRQIPHYHSWASIFNFIWVRTFVLPLMFLLHIVSTVFGSGGGNTGNGGRRGNKGWWTLPTTTPTASSQAGAGGRKRDHTGSWA